MKKMLFTAFVVFATLAFSSCQKENVSILDSKNLVTITLTADKAGDDTKAAAIEGSTSVSYEWTSTDLSNLKLFTVTLDDNNKEVLTEVENPTLTLSSNNRILSITATVEANSTLRAAVAKEWTGSSKPRQPITQNPPLDNFDPNADILVSEDVIASGTVTEQLNFIRPVTVNKMTLKGLTEGERVVKAVLYSEDNLIGYYEWDAATPAMSGQHKDITIRFDDVNAIVDANGQLPIYFVAIPHTGHMLSLVVETIKGSKSYRYTKSDFGPVSFTDGKFTKFGVNLSGLGVEIVDVDYSGEWVIAGTHEGYDLAATAYLSGNFYSASVVALDATNRIVTVTGSADPYKMTINRVLLGDFAGLYTICDANGNYLSATGGSSNNYMTGKSVEDIDETSYWSITKNTDGTYDILAENLPSDGKKAMRVNYNSGNNPRISCFSTSSPQPKVSLYPFNNVVESYEGYRFQKVSSVTSGKKYLIVTEQSSSLLALKRITSSYGYPTVEIVSDVNGVIVVPDLANAVTFTSQGDNGYTIKQSDDRLWYLDETHTSINVSASPTSAQYFSVVKNSDDTFKITNISRNKYLQYAVAHGSFGCYIDEQGVMPSLYELIVVPESIEVSGQTTSFVKDAPFSFGGTVTVTYSDGTVADVTGSSTFSGYNMSTVGNQTVTVSYSEGETTVTTTYEIVINEVGEAVTIYYETFGTTGSNTAISKYSGWSWTGDLRPSSTSWKVSKSNLSGSNVSTDAYAGASGSCNLYSGTSGAGVVFNFGDIDNYSNVALSFGWANSAANNKPRTLTVEVSGDGGTNWTSISFTTSANATTNDGFHYFVYDVPNSLLSNFSVRFTNTASNTSRIDDIQLVGTAN